MDTYAYLFLGLFLSIIWGVVCYLRKDLRTKLYKASAIGAVVGPLSEYWYSKDYWNPPRMFSWGVFSIEDVLFGAAVLGISAVLYEAVSRRKSLPKDKGRPLLFLGLFLACALGVFVFTDLLGFPSIFVTAFLFLFAAAFMVAHRTDLFLPSIATGGLLLVVITTAYLLLFGIFFPNFWRDYLFLYDTSLGWMLSHSVPFTELLWHFSLGCVGGISSHFIRGTAPLFAPSITKLILKRGLGVLLVSVGIISLVTPFTPGSWLAIVGLELLGLGFLIPKPIRKTWEKYKPTFLK